MGTPIFAQAPKRDDYFADQTSTLLLSLSRFP
jgi:hypothetical protein